MPPVVLRVKFFKSSRFGSVTTGCNTLLKFWFADYALGPSLVKMCSFCSLSICLSVEEVSVTVVVFLLLYIFAYFLRKKTVMHSVYVSSDPHRDLPLDPFGGLPSPRPPVLSPFPLSKFLATPVELIYF